VERKSKQAFWTRHVRAFEASGQTRVAYCERHGLAIRSLDYWRGRLSSASGSAAAVPAFVALQVRPTASAESLLLECAGGAVLRVTCGCDPACLAAVLSGLH
jgi:hypothetical protein